MRSRTALLSVSPLTLTVGCGAAMAADRQSKVDPWVLDTAGAGQTEFLVMLREQADLRGARSARRKTEKGAFVRDALASRPSARRRPCSRCSPRAASSTAPSGSPT